MLLEVLPFGAECWPRLPARTGDEAVRSSDPARRRRRVPALTRPGPCLDGQTPFGTSACRHRTGPCGLPCPTMGPATTPVTPRWGRASGTWPTDSPRSAAGARSGPPPASAQRLTSPRHRTLASAAGHCQQRTHRTSASPSQPPIRGLITPSSRVGRRSAVTDRAPGHTDQPVRARRGQWGW